MRRQRNHGMTLAELLVAGFLMTMFGIAAVGSLNLALRQQNRVAAKVNCLQNARFLASVISTELNQAIPNESVARGWQTITPALSANSIPPGGPTAVEMPTINNTTSATLQFMEPHPQNFNPLNTGQAWNSAWTPLSPDVYQRVRYFATGVGANVTVGGSVRATNTTIMREVITYNAAGTPGSPSTEAIATGAAINITYTWLAKDLFQIDVICGEAQRTSTDCAQKTDPAYRTTVFIQGR